MPRVALAQFTQPFIYTWCQQIAGLENLEVLVNVFDFNVNNDLSPYFLNVLHFAQTAPLPLLS